jgi:hypothetical protein
MTRLIALAIVLPVFVASAMTADAATKKKKPSMTACQQWTSRSQCLAHPPCQWFTKGARCIGKIGT